MMERLNNPEFIRYILDNYGHLLRGYEREATHATMLMAQAKTTSSVGVRSLLMKKAGTVSAEAKDFLSLEGSCDERVVARILRESETELWMNQCEECGRLARTALAQQCRHCGDSWFGTPSYGSSIHKATLDFQRCGDRVVTRQIPNVGLLLCVADGAGNSSMGAAAADALLREVKSHQWGPSLDEWDLQELLMRVDESVHRSGGETTVMLAVLRTYDLIAAAAGDTQLFGTAEGVGWVFPDPRTRYRIGSGMADVRVLRREVRCPLAIATDGAVAALGRGELLSRMVPDCDGDLDRWARERIDARIGQVGDDSTFVSVRLCSGR